MGLGRWAGLRCLGKGFRVPCMQQGVPGSLVQGNDSARVLASDGSLCCPVEDRPQ